jgi:hypothetical protein
MDLNSVISVVEKTLAHLISVVEKALAIIYVVEKP